MKKLFIFSILICLFVGCKAPIAMQSGREDIAYLVFVSPKTYWNKEVNVSIDNETNFEAKVVKAKRSNRWGRQYGISTGRRNIKVSSLHCHEEIIIIRSMYDSYSIMHHIPKASLFLV